MNEKEERLVADILDIFSRLPEDLQNRLLGFAQGLDAAIVARN